MAYRPTAPRTVRRAAVLAGSALLASGLLLGAVGCSPIPHVSVVRDGVSVSTGSESTTIPFSSLRGEARTVTVTGTDSVAATPDTVELMLGIAATADTADEAQQQASDALDAVTAALEELGIDADDISSGDVYLSPQYDYSSSTEKITGYQMNISVTVQGLDIERAGKAITAATGAGANRVNGVSYYCSDYDGLYQQALGRALAMAQEKAAALADANGDELGELLSVVEGYDGQAYRPTEPKAYAAGAMTDEASSDNGMALDPGTVQIEANVTVEYEVL